MYEDSICSGFLGLFEFEQRSTELIIGTPRKTPRYFKRLGHGDRGHGTMCGQPIEEWPIPQNWAWFPGSTAPYPTEMPPVRRGRPATLLMWTPYARCMRSNREECEILISAWKEMHRPKKVVMRISKRGDSYVRVGLEHRQYGSYQQLEAESRRQAWQWVAI